MNRSVLKNRSFVLVVLALMSALTLPQATQAQFVHFVRAIPERDSDGTPLPGANTTFADGTLFQPVGDLARSHQWAWRPFGNGGILSSLGPNTSTPPSNTKELVTTVSNLTPGAVYDVKALFWNTGSWGVRAGLKYAGELRTNSWFNATAAGVVKADLLPWQTMPSIFSESGRTLHAAPLGTVTANSNGEVKVFIHDMPSADSILRTWYQGVAVAEVIEPALHVIHCNAAGTRFHRGVRGIALTDPQINWLAYWVGNPKSLEAARGSSIRGVSTGLAADRYDWRTRNDQPRGTTLQFLRHSRDFEAELFLGVNIRGLVEPNPEGGYRYYDTNTTTLAALAADWVRYVNHIVPSYRQGDTIGDDRDAAILSSIRWSSAFPGDSFDKLLAPGETSVPLIRYWEIGNEPTIGVTSFSVSNSFTMNPTDFHLRYKAIVEAIKAENPNVKVGPTLVHAGREAAHLAALVSDSFLPLDFITYHPYEKMGLLDDPTLITMHLGSIYSRQLSFYNEIRKVVAENGRDPDAIEYAATEVNVSNWDTNDTVKESQMAHALGTVETVFNHARLGLIASHYWIWPSHPSDGTEYPLFKAYQKLRDHMGDTLVSTYTIGDIRLYTTRDSRTGEIAVWMLNFSNDQNATVDLRFENLLAVKRATLLRLADKSGTTTLFSSNLSSEMPGGPTLNVDWTSSDLTGQQFTNRQLSLPAATLSVLIIEPGLGRLTPSLVEQDGKTWLRVSFQPLPFASDVRYRLLGSADLTSWTDIEEVGSEASGWISMTDNLPLQESTRRYFRVELVRD